MYKISIYGCAMFKKLVCQWVNIHWCSQPIYSDIPRTPMKVYGHTQPAGLLL